MAAEHGEDAYVTLLLSDNYLPGALVLAHSLRDAGTTKKLAVLVTLDSVSAEVVTQLNTVFDFVLPVPRISNAKPANLYLMNRADLHSAFTKINLWKQTQFRRIVYLDADVVAYRAVDELFDLPQPFSAAPDVGWPDLFNSGVMALTPNLGDYYAMKAMAERGISFDGADQGLLNMHFKNSYNRLSFAYNVTPSAHYSYVPAYRHFQSSINLVHFIGSDKPWTQGRSASAAGDSPYGEMIGRWWAVYDRHYRQPSPPSTPTGGPERKVPEIVQYFVKGEFNPPTTTYIVPVGEPPLPEGQVTGTPEGAPAVHHEEREHKPQAPPVAHSWDAQRQPPPPDSKPEAANFPKTHYEMSSDYTPFVPPKRYPSPPKNMWYEVPKEKPAPPTEKPRPIFPWEAQQPRPTRVFTDEEPPSDPEPSMTEGSTMATSESSDVEQKSQASTTTTPLASFPPADPWASFTRVNAWDDHPAIEKYVDSMPLFRKHRSQGSIVGQQSPGQEGGGSDARSQQDTSAGAEWRRRGSKLTDFPTAVERPSLPVTPAPIRRPKFWGAGGPGTADEDEDDDQLPAADGVPRQSDWDPVARLQLLAQQQSELLLQKLGSIEAAERGGGGGSVGVAGHDIPKRSLPFGSDTIISPTIFKQGHHESGNTPRTTEAADKSTRPAATDSPIPEPSYHGPGAAWEKNETYAAHSTVLPPSEEEKDVLET